ncbi:MAG: hypothetical protein LBQ23_03275 [Puniceicoccales bacterium]|jgi:hypothetical protein|nr:hypothetical protein [Puniceicoccales bacterium]
MEGKFLTQLTLKFWQTIRNSPIISIEIAKNMIGKITSVPEQHTGPILATRDVAVPIDNSHDPEQKESTFKFVQQMVSKICNLATGTAMILSAWNFKNAGNMIGLFSNLTQYIISVSSKKHAHLPEKHVHWLMPYLYNADEKKIVFKKLVLSTSAMCKVILAFVPKLTSLQLLSKAFPWVNFSLEIMELFLNYEKFTKDGPTLKNIFKITVAISYHAMLCATFAMAGPAGCVITKCLSTALLFAFHSLTNKGMGTIIDISVSIDKLCLKDKLADNIHALFEPFLANEPYFSNDDEANKAKSHYFTMTGLYLCCSATFAIIKLIVNHRKDTTNETTASEVPDQTGVVDNN